MSEQDRPALTKTDLLDRSARIVRAWEHANDFSGESAALAILNEYAAALKVEPGLLASFG